MTEVLTTRRLMPILVLAGLSLAACGDKDSADDTGSTGSGGDDTADDGGDGGSQVAALAELSSGECPDLSEPGVKTFTSSGSERTAVVLFPEDPDPGLNVVFFFHGLMDTSTSPAQYFASSFDLQSVADDTNSIIVLPQSEQMSLAGFSFYMWDAMEIGDEDVVLYDDLRTCVAQELEADMERVAAMGFSGGALFTTTIARERGDTLAAIASMSGGADAEVPTFDELTARYDTPAYAMPSLVISGGGNDVWPGGGLTVIDFEAASDTLEQHLVDDGHFVVRCRHEKGHTIPQALYTFSQDWALGHTFGETSPWEDGSEELPGNANCEISSASAE